MTKLITIDYDEYLRLKTNYNDLNIKVANNIIDCLEQYRKNYNPNKDVNILLNNLVSYLHTRIIDSKYDKVWY